MTSNPDIQPIREPHKQLKIQFCRKHHETDNMKQVIKVPLRILMNL